ncbi:MAG: tetratricopeptide repeat protein [Gammaproteobacteria bacterium]|nr:tetratricopeptide repeat protein [Gammaproteobacteria bacterium]MYF37829.1 tetratricopeptide repeat protein [Gammaproteobacteria bacterium]
MADFLTEEEQAARLQKLWRDYGLIVVLALLVGIGAVVGWNYFQKSQLQAKEDAAYEFQMFLIERGLEGDLDAFVEEMAKTRAGARYVPMTLLYRAKDAVEAAEYESALAFLEDALVKSKDKILDDLINVRIARIQMQLQQDDAALVTLAKVGEDYKFIVLELTGDIYRAKENYAEAVSAYEQAMEQTTSGIDRERLQLKITLMPGETTTNDQTNTSS